MIHFTVRQSPWGKPFRARAAAPTKKRETYSQETAEVVAPCALGCPCSEMAHYDYGYDTPGLRSERGTIVGSESWGNGVIEFWSIGVLRLITQRSCAHYSILAFSASFFLRRLFCGGRGRK